MYKKYMKKFLALFISLVIALFNLTYADNVVLGIAPGLVDGRTISANTNTTYLQNLYTGPGLAPNSSVTGLTPIQVTNNSSVETTNTYNNVNTTAYTNNYPYNTINTNTNAYTNVNGYTNGYTNTYPVNNGYAYNNGNVNTQNRVMDTNNVSNSGPTVTTIKSPASNMKTLANSSTNVGVIANNALMNNGRIATGTTTEDRGPTTAEPIISPTEHGILTSNTDIGPGINNSTETTELPSYETSAENRAGLNINLIQYRTNDYIQAVKPSVSAEVALVVNATTRQIYFSKGGLTLCPPASLANLVTASILIANKNLDDVLSVSQTAVSNLESGASVAGLKVGDVITVRDALGALFVASCCDVANVVAENVAGSIPNFVAIMNQTVKSWGCVATSFVNPSGLNNDAQMTTSYDMAIIMDKATSNAILKTMMQQATYTLPATAHRGAKVLTNKNSIIIPGNKHYYTGIAASRMGYTSKARYTIASTIDYNGQKFIAVVLRANGTQWVDTTRLLNFAKVASLEASAQTGQHFSTSLNASAGFGNVTNATLGTSISQKRTNANNTTNNNSLMLNGSDTVGTWMQDGSGWYFIKADGQRVTNEWIRQGNKLYCIDSTGYMVKGWRQMSNGSTYYFDPNSGELRYNTWINVSTGAYYLQADGTLAKADPGTTKNIVTAVGTYTINDTGKATAKVS